MVTKIINCRHCGSENIIKFGKTPNHKQRYRCHDCGKQSRENPTVKYTEEQKEMILRVYQERSSLRGLQRAFGVSPNTVFELVKKNDNRCDRSKARFLRPAAMMSLNWTNCGLLWGARAMPNGFGSLFADAPVKSSPMPLGLGIGIVAGNFTSVCHGPTKDVPPTATFGALMMKSFLITDPWEKKPVKRPMWNDGTIPCANDWVVSHAKPSPFPSLRVCVNAGMKPVRGSG